MKRFDVYSGNTLVGWSDLGGVDRSMATAYGAFNPVEGYVCIQSAVLALADDQGALDLGIRLESKRDGGS